MNKSFLMYFFHVLLDYNLFEINISVTILEILNDQFTMPAASRMVGRNLNALHFASSHGHVLELQEKIRDVLSIFPSAYYTQYRPSQDTVMIRQIFLLEKPLWQEVEYK